MCTKWLASTEVCGLRVFLIRHHVSVGANEDLFLFHINWYNVGLLGASKHYNKPRDLLQRSHHSAVETTQLQKTTIVSDIRRTEQNRWRCKMKLIRE